MNVVFTGPAFDSDGYAITRQDLAYACIVQGDLTVQPSVTGDTDVLVASRTDTIKAKNAANRGLKVLTYPEFIDRYLHDTPVKRGSKPNRYFDSVDRDLLVPCFIDATKLALQDIL